MNNIEATLTNIKEMCNKSSNTLYYLDLDSITVSPLTLAVENKAPTLTICNAAIGLYNHQNLYMKITHPYYKHIDVFVDIYYNSDPRITVIDEQTIKLKNGEKNIYLTTNLETVKKLIRTKFKILIKEDQRMYLESIKLCRELNTDLKYNMRLKEFYKNLMNTIKTYYDE